MVGIIGGFRCSTNFFTQHICKDAKIIRKIKSFETMKKTVRESFKVLSMTKTKKIISGNLAAYVIQKYNVDPMIKIYFKMYTKVTTDTGQEGKLSMKFRGPLIARALNEKDGGILKDRVIKNILWEYDVDPGMSFGGENILEKICNSITNSRIELLIRHGFWLSGVHNCRTRINEIVKKVQKEEKEIWGIDWTVYHMGK
eukprot:UN32354